MLRARARPSARAEGWSKADSRRATPGDSLPRRDPGALPLMADGTDRRGVSFSSTPWSPPGAGTPTTSGGDPAAADSRAARRSGKPRPRRKLKRQFGCERRTGALPVVDRYPGRARADVGARPAARHPGRLRRLPGRVGAGLPGPARADRDRRGVGLPGPDRHAHRVGQRLPHRPAGLHLPDQGASQDPAKADRRRLRSVQPDGHGHRALASRGAEGGAPDAPLGRAPGVPRHPGHAPDRRPAGSGDAGAGQAPGLRAGAPGRDRRAPARTPDALRGRAQRLRVDRSARGSRSPPRSSCDSPRRTTRPSRGSARPPTARRSSTTPTRSSWTRSSGGWPTTSRPTPRPCGRPPRTGPSSASRACASSTAGSPGSSGRRSPRSSARPSRRSPTRRTRRRTSTATSG